MQYIHRYKKHFLLKLRFRNYIRCSEVSHQKAHTQTESNYKLIFLYMLKNIEII